MQSITSVKNLKGKTVIVRTDYNVPIKNNKIIDDFRIKSSLKTINFLIKKGAKVLIISHIGDGGEGSLDLVSKNLSKKIKNKFIKINDGFDFNKIKAEILDSKNGSVFLLDNIRKFEGEKTNDKNFAKQIASVGDIYVNDASSASHRSHASIVGIAKFLPHYAGFLFENEIKNISKAINDPKHPVLSIIGGAKFSTKIPVIKSLLNISDLVFVGGALANSMLAEKGFEIGKSLFEEDSSIKSLIKNKKIILPIDVVVDSKENKDITLIDKSETICDIGNETISVMAEIIHKAKTIIWNGPLGIYENGFDNGSKKLLKAVSDSRAYSLVGGGDIVSVINNSKNKFKISYVSTGGGATLEFIAKKTLPGIKALK